MQFEDEVTPIDGVDVEKLRASQQDADREAVRALGLRQTELENRLGELEKQVHKVVALAGMCWRKIKGIRETLLDEDHG